MLGDALRYLGEHEDGNLARLGELLRIPSISTDAARKSDVRRAAHWIHECFQSCGLRSRILETPVHPCVVADSDPGGRAGPTLLVYGHYDVQPVGDTSLWDSPPFGPDVRNGSIFARGASDDKGQLFTHLLAAEAWLKAAGRLPVRVKYLIEGEEEIGSPSMAAILADNVLQHSQEPSTGLVAFCGCRGVFEYVVADSGIGMLASLRAAPEFRSLRDDVEALPLTITPGVSRWQRFSWACWFALLLGTSSFGSAFPLSDPSDSLIKYGTTATLECR